MTRQQSPLQQQLFKVIYRFDSTAGKVFDLALLLSIITSIVLIILDSIPSLHSRYGDYFFIGEWLFTGIFLTEYLLRIYCHPNPRFYIFSFYGLVDLLAVLPAFLALVLPGTQSLLVIRALRVLRVFRVLKLAEHVSQANLLMRALIAGRQKVTVFLFSICTLILIFSALIYLVEGPEHGFTSIPKSIYWAIVTITTVGYGDVTPQTPMGQAIASLMMITGYSIIAVPTGIFTAELAQAMRRGDDKRQCKNCDKQGHSHDARYCDACGHKLDPIT